MGKSPDGKPITPYKGSWAETEAAKKRLRRARPTTLEDRVNAKLHAVGEALSHGKVNKVRIEDGTSGQDRDSYSDTQDRESYTVDEPEVDEDRLGFGPEQEP